MNSIKNLMVVASQLELEKVTCVLELDEGKLEWEALEAAMVCLLEAIISSIRITSNSADSTMTPKSQCSMKKKILREANVKLIKVKAIYLWGVTEDHAVVIAVTVVLPQARWILITSIQWGQNSDATMLRSTDKVKLIYIITLCKMIKMLLLLWVYYQHKMRIFIDKFLLHFHLKIF